LTFFSYQLDDELETSISSNTSTTDGRGVVVVSMRGLYGTDGEVFQ
jgi:hypothetical protein